MKKLKNAFIVYILYFLALGPAYAQLTESNTSDPDWEDPADWTNGAPGYTVEDLDVNLLHNSTISNVLKISTTVVIESGATLTTSADILIEEGGELIVNGTLIGTNLKNEGSLTINGDVSLSGNFTANEGDLTINSGGTLNVDGDFVKNEAAMVVDGAVTIGGDFTNESDITGDGSIQVDGTLNNDGGTIFGCSDAGDACCQGSDPCNLSEEPLPVKVAYFNSSAEKSHVTLHWATTFEENFDYFTIERSPAGYEFNPIGKVFSSEGGNSEKFIEYEFTDEAPLEGYSYYRLKATDYDDFTEYHGVVSVKLEGVEDKLKLFPNPSSGHEVEIDYNGRQKSRYKLVSFTGEVIETGMLRTGSNRLRFAQTLSPGIYFIYLDNRPSARPVKLMVR